MKKVVQLDGLVIPVLQNVTAQIMELVINKQGNAIVLQGLKDQDANMDVKWDFLEMDARECVIVKVYLAILLLDNVYVLQDLLDSIV